ncbi:MULTISPECIES: polyprenyl synthetase family protein [Streptomyces]|uniref:Polyprenyl synthetase family protein n=1 Tax=Streptomyces tsukubensis (strain DSM 42081 / NBRC 108919 / NRRL 18488 / 9993) TaxID=1114943 RepID=I2MXV4_STRT9|nr:MULTISPECIES: polyprenyl synthetase family protein [Streptomyces]AZK93964.1 geranylgeranyl diphosphate synthase [Streptomyces tsukubensis]EIF89601.1 Geranylgeranyl diphosphate synthase [Streptomyces tsukubensis NRRL18488]MYS66084.1 polyprenyl synthetase family protein [Streptomyces sp. SID5473]QKM69916.1 polyprenyl synthetase family protein [Streptomyces tsukubensis NRRL18488]TAI46107.1 polyprenyl synthetase family protein [Streptomyces tsukubensis]
MTTTAPAEPYGADSDQTRAEVDSALGAFLADKARAAAGQRMPGEVTALLADFLAAGGKRIRPLLCLTGWHVAGGRGHPLPVVRAAAGLEMFHAFCLIHDDVMDRSDTRRGRPTLHRTLAARHAAGRTVTAAQRLGAGTAVLIGDLALTWADELLHTAGLSHKQLTDVLPLLHAMRTEVMYGQYLDVTATGTPTADVGRALAICRYKTAKYTIERPLHIGAALAGAEQTLLDSLSAFAIPLGEAFQLRDDLLGVFGDTAHTGKPALDDLREGKATVLFALALRHATRTQANRLRPLLGHRDLTHDQAATARDIITATGAVHHVETMITERYAQALHHLRTAPLEPASIRLLHDFADTAVRRTA